MSKRSVRSIRSNASPKPNLWCPRGRGRLRAARAERTRALRAPPLTPRSIFTPSDSTRALGGTLFSQLNPSSHMSQDLAHFDLAQAVPTTRRFYSLISPAAPPPSR